MSKDLLREQREYYRARANEYDEWFLRQGGYDRGPEMNARWFAEVDTVASALDDFRPTGEVLELACGTGLWTSRLVSRAAHLTAVDAAPEVLALNRNRLGSAPVTYVQADLFAWEPPVNQFDVVFFGFWLSHVPPDRFDSFWELLRRALRPTGRFFFIDSRDEPCSTALDQQPADRTANVTARTLNDGRKFEIYKIFYEPDELKARLAHIGWSAEIRQTSTYFIYGFGTRL